MKYRVKNYTDAYYEQPKFWGQTYTRPEERERVNDIASLIPKDAGSILDAGCGDGILANHLYENYNIVAMDRALVPLGYVKPPKIRADISELPFSDGSFDMVICAEVLEHLPYGVYEQALSELQRVSKKYIIVSVPNDESTSFVKCDYCGCVFSNYRHLRTFISKNMEELFSGFQLERILECGSKIRQNNRKIMYLLGVGGCIGSETALCPQCGKDKCISQGIPNLVGRYAFSLLRRNPFPRITKRWIIALYKKYD